MSVIAPRPLNPTTTAATLGLEDQIDAYWGELAIAEVEVLQLTDPRFDELFKRIRRRRSRTLHWPAAKRQGRDCEVSVAHSMVRRAAD